MRDKITYYLLLTCFFGGMILSIGTAGASDFGSIGLKQTIIQGTIGIGLTIAGFLGLKIGGYDVWED